MNRRIVVIMTAAFLFSTGCGLETLKSEGAGGDWTTGARSESASNGAGGEGGSMAVPSSAEGADPGMTDSPSSEPSGTEGPIGAPQVSPGTLTAGSFDDHLNSAAFDAFLKGTAQEAALTERALVKVVTAAGAPASQATVNVSVAGQVLLSVTTGSDGRALFLPAFDGQSATGKYDVQVTMPNGDTTQGSFSLANAPWVLTVASAAALPTKLDLAFVVDATGSMGDEMAFLKAEIGYIASQLQNSFGQVDTRFGLIVYRDEGDAYITKGFAFSSLAAFQANLAQQKAGGGGDYPEAMHTALAEAATKFVWRQGDVARMAFLIADAPPHGQQIEATAQAFNALRKMGVKVYPVAASGVAEEAEQVMRAGAFATLGRYLFLTDDSGVGSAHAEPTIPCYYVEKLQELMIRMISSELAGVLIDTDLANVVRTVGAPVGGVCQSEATPPQ